MGQKEQGSVLAINSEIWEEIMDRLRKWDERFLRQAEYIASWSKDTSTKVGCVITTPDRRILSTGYNGVPRGVDDNPKLLNRHDREQDKYLFYEHAERNALYNAANIGVSVKDSTAYITMPPCADCARGLISSGVKRVVWAIDPDPSRMARWAESLKISKLMLDEAKVLNLGLQIHPQLEGHDVEE